MHPKPHQPRFSFLFVCIVCLVFISCATFRVERFYTREPQPARINARLIMDNSSFGFELPYGLRYTKTKFQLSEPSSYKRVEMQFDLVAVPETPIKTANPGRSRFSSVKWTASKITTTDSAAVWSFIRSFPSHGTASFRGQAGQRDIPLDEYGNVLRSLHMPMEDALNAIPSIGIPQIFESPSPSVGSRQTSPWTMYVLYLKEDAKTPPFTLNSEGILELFAMFGEKTEPTCAARSRPDGSLAFYPPDAAESVLDVYGGTTRIVLDSAGSTDVPRVRFAGSPSGMFSYDLSWFRGEDNWVFRASFYAASFSGPWNGVVEAYHDADRKSRVVSSASSQVPDPPYRLERADLY
ncbi:hypothetical protein EHM69_11600, partial [candidate division KSB1 bacterium]